MSGLTLPLGRFLWGVSKGVKVGVGVIKYRSLTTFRQPLIIPSTPTLNLRLLSSSSKPVQVPESQSPNSSLEGQGQGQTVAKKSRTKMRRPQPPPLDHKFDLKNSFPIFSYGTCEELDLEGLYSHLLEQDLYAPTPLSDDMEDVIHVTAKYKISEEPREIFFFREGAVVFWNMPEQECMNMLKFMKKCEHESYPSDQVIEEIEYMRYYYNDQGNSRLSKGRIFINIDSENKLMEKYSFSNALASSVKLGIWESTLDNFVDSIAHITDVLKKSQKLKLSREEVLQKTGELYSLRHELNLNSDLLDTPDFYWDRERLENIYQKTCNYLNLGRRTKVLNEKMTQCSELLELISTHLNDRHHTRLEWMIILLIMIEVMFEILHFAERYVL